MKSRFHDFYDACIRKHTRFDESAFELAFAVDGGRVRRATFVTF